ncbi:hypothetical protein GCM10023170_098980 [Phytohabitans houttuyneae]
MVRLPAQRQPERVPREARVQPEFDDPGRLEPGSAFAFRIEADPRDAASVRPFMDAEERAELYRVLEEGARSAADHLRSRQSEAPRP